MTELEKAQQKYKEYSRNYYHYKDMYEDHYYNEETASLNKDTIKGVTSKMNHAFDMLETLSYIFGNKVRS